MAIVIYGGKFEAHINELYSPKNIRKTAKIFAEYENEHGPYKFGQQYTKVLDGRLGGQSGIDGGTRQVGKELRRDTRGHSQQADQGHPGQSAIRQAEADALEGG
jgi:hypothetical protein